MSAIGTKRTCGLRSAMSTFEGKADIQRTDNVHFRTHIRHQLSKSTLTRHFDGQILDARSLNWLGIKTHESHYLTWHTYFDGEAQSASLLGGELIVMRPMAARKLCGKRLRRRALHS